MLSDQPRHELRWECLGVERRKASLEVIEGAAHFCFVTRHDQFNTAVDDFLAQRLAAIS